VTRVTALVAARYERMDRESELELVRRLREGDSAAFDVVYAAYNARLFTFLARLARSRERAEDLLEETWLRLVTHAARLRPDTKLGPWLFTVARNLHVSWCRSRLLEDTSLAVGLDLWPVASRPSPFEETAANEFERRLESTLAGLPAAYREVLLLVAVEGLSASEAAGVCGITPVALRQRLKRARDLLNRRLDRGQAGRPVLLEVDP
jgi:RNA polymerase sigma-70 factor, ECF subfamily